MSLAKGGRRRYRIQVFTLFKECRIDNHDTSFTYRELMNLLPRLDGIDATKKDLVMLKYLSFSQSVRNTIPDITNDEGAEVIEEDDPTTVLARQLSEPFREDYENEPLQTLPAPTTFSRRPVKRTAPRNAAVIGSSSLSERFSKHRGIRQKAGKYSKVKLRKQSQRSRHAVVLPELYLSLENVIQSMVRTTVDENIADQPIEDDEEMVKRDSEDVNDDETPAVDFQMNSDETADNSKSVVETVNGLSDGRAEDSSCNNTTVLNKSDPPGIPLQVEESMDKDINDINGRSNDEGSFPGTDANELYQESDDQDENISSCPTEVIGNRNDVDDDQSSEFEALRLEHNENVPGSSVSISVADDNESISEKDDPEVSLKRIDFASTERSAVYGGPDSYSKLCIAQYFELYFRCYVFPSTSHNESIDLYEDSSQHPTVPQVQLYQSDRDLMMWALAQNIAERQEIASHLHNPSNENLVMVSKENILPCGLGATARIQPHTADVKGSKGQTLYSSTGNSYSISRSQDLLFCVTSKAVYFIPDFAGTNTDNSIECRRFPSPIPLDATFANALWPHAYCRLPLKHLRKIAFDGYGFQRLTLYFKLPSLRGAVYAQPENGLSSAFDYTYVIFTCNQRHTIKLLQNIQGAAKDASFNDSVIVENDNNGTIQAISRALTRKSWSDDILLYQIIHQSWQNREIEDARRSFILTNDEVFLFNETYAGDSSECALEEDISNIRFGDISMRTISSANIQDVADICIAKDDPKMITMNIKSQSRLRRPTYWILRCYDNENAERLVETVRKASKAAASTSYE
jgi:hypothetical protein